MGFFSEIVNEARRGMTTPANQPAVPAAPKPAPAPPAAAPEVPAEQPVPTPPAPDRAAVPVQAPTQAEHTPSATTPPPEVKLSVEDDSPAPDDTTARQAHEAVEAKRKAEWDAKQAEARAKRQAALDRIKDMNDAELLAASVERVAADTERLTRHNMKEAVAEHIQAKCRKDAAFAMLVMDPAKSMINCFQYINRKAREYAEQEMKGNGIERTGVYGLDVPDDLCFQWAEDYFRKEDTNEEKYVPKPYVPPTNKPSKAKAAKGKSEQKKPAEDKPKDTVGSLEQISLM